MNNINGIQDEEKNENNLYNNINQENENNNEEIINNKGDANQENKINEDNQDLKKIAEKSIGLAKYNLINDINK